MDVQFLGVVRDCSCVGIPYCNTCRWNLVLYVQAQVYIVTVEVWMAVAVEVWMAMAVEVWIVVAT